MLLTCLMLKCPIIIVMNMKACIVFCLPFSLTVSLQTCVVHILTLCFRLLYSSEDKCSQNFVINVHCLKQV